MSRREKEQQGKIISECERISKRQRERETNHVVIDFCVKNPKLLLKRKSKITENCLAAVECKSCERKNLSDSNNSERRT